jgi:hypothetical protein
VSPGRSQQLEPKTYSRYGTVGEASGGTGAGRRTFQVLDSPKALGDLTGDPQPEALLHVRCSEFPDGSMQEKGAQLLAVTMREDHSLVGLGYVGQVHAQYPSFRIAEGQVVAQLRYQVIDRSRRDIRGTTWRTRVHLGRTRIQAGGRPNPAAAIRCRGGGYDATSLYLARAGLDVPVANDGTHTIRQATLALRKH